jgi:aminoglycoside 6'-N-acetyltransferase I
MAASWQLSISTTQAAFETSMQNLLMEMLLKRVQILCGARAQEADAVETQIVDLQTHNTEYIDQIANLLVAAFVKHTPIRHDVESARKEVMESLGSDRLSRVAVKDGEAVGWVGGIKAYDGNAWELHPLVVKPELHGQGIGMMLVRDLERLVYNLGAHTLWLGCDDEDGRTTLGGVDLYPHVWEHISQIRNLRRHPFEFYQKAGFSIVGVVPDANGPGKPDILMAKRVCLPLAE